MRGGGQGCGSLHLLYNWFHEQAAECGGVLYSSAEKTLLIHLVASQRLYSSILRERALPLEPLYRMPHMRHASSFPCQTGYHSPRQHNVVLT